MKKENDILEETLAIAEKGYGEAYNFLLNAYENNEGDYGPQTLYFLACLAGGNNMATEALEWLRKAIVHNGWWYRPEVLEDEDLQLLENNSEYISLKSISDARYENAVSEARALFSWKKKTADKLFLGVHGNTQNGETARNDWQPLFMGSEQWQIETIQSAQPDGYGTYRWSYDMVSYLPVAEEIQKMQDKGYQKIVCGGFSAGCDMLLRAIIFTSACCDVLILQSPWIPVLKDYSDALLLAIRQKNIALRIFCGSEDEDCLPLAKQLYNVLDQEDLDVKLTIQENSRHQFHFVTTDKEVQNEWISSWKKEESLAHIHGWDFSHIAGRYTEETDLPWDYKSIIQDYLKPEMKLLDIDTGGGEFLLSLHHPYENTSAAEAYPPNIELCRKTLLPLGIDFRAGDGKDVLPFDDSEFDIVINRHGDFNVKEIYRVLKQGGIFITEQVGAENDRELVELLLGKTELPFPEQYLKIVRKQFSDAGFDILNAQECFRPIRFYDIGALVWFAHIIEWEFPGFSVEQCKDRLLYAQQLLEQNGCVEGKIHRFLLVCSKN